MWDYIIWLSQYQPLKANVLFKPHLVEAHNHVDCKFMENYLHVKFGVSISKRSSSSIIYHAPSRDGRVKWARSDLLENIRIVDQLQTGIFYKLNLNLTWFFLIQNGTNVLIFYYDELNEFSLNSTRFLLARTHPIKLLLRMMVVVC